MSSITLIVVLPNPVIGSSTDDQIKSAGNPREIQVGFKIVL